MLGIAPAARLSQLVAPLVDRDAATELAAVDATIAEGADVSQLIGHLLGYFRDVMTQAVGCDESRLLYALPSQRQEVREIAQQLGVQTLLAIVQVLDHAASRMRVSTHTRTLVEMAVVRICSLENLDDLSSLIEQLREGTLTTSTSAVKKNSNASAPISRPRTSSPQIATPSPALAVDSDQSVPATNGHHEEPEAAVPTLALTSENVQQVWKQALGFLAADSLVSDFAEQISEVSVDEIGRLVLVFPNDLLRGQCEKPAKRTHFESALESVTGGRVPMVFQSRKRVDAPTVAVAPAPSRRQQQADVATQPFVKKALELFDGDQHRIRYVPPAE